MLLSEYNGFYRERTRRGKCEIQLYSKEIYLEVKDLKKNPVKHLVENPIEFITGLVDGDGSITRNEIAIYSKNKQLLDSISEFLHEIGIRNVVKPCKNIWRIRIRSRKSIEKFLRLFPVLKSRI